jgi:hypothetical protein
MIKQIDIPSEFGEIEKLVDQLAAPDQHWNIEKISPWHPAFRHNSELHYLKTQNL